MGWIRNFRFKPGKVKDQLTSDRLNGMLDGIRMGQPSLNGHKGLIVRQTNQGWTAEVLKDPRKAIKPHPWKIIRDENLDVDMVDGILFSSATATGIPAPQTVSTSTITLPNNATTEIWAKASIENTAFATFFVLWYVDNIVIESGAEMPDDTLDLEDIESGEGDVHFLIAEVTTEDGKVTNINQVLRDSYYLVFPLGIEVAEFECPEEEEEEEE